MAQAKPPISIQLYTVREAAAKDFFGVLKQIAEIGYVGVESAGLHGKTPKEVRKVLDDLGLKMSSAHVGLPTKETLNEAVDTAKTLGYSILVTGYGPDQFKTADSIKAAAAKFQEGAALLKPHGLKLGYHNHWWEFDKVDGKLGYDIFMAEAKDVLGQLDIYWATNFGAVNTPDVIKRYGKRVPLLHVKDGPLVKDQPHTAVGSGKVNIPACVKAADPQALQWLIVELDACATDMMEAVRQSYKYLAGTSGLAGGKR
jgi:sugar phosphate isomerase/epimerase